MSDGRVARFDAWHLPSGALPLEIQERRLDDDASPLLLRQAVTTPALVQAACAALLDAGETLRRRPVASIVEALAAVGARFQSGGADRPIAEHALTAATGYSRPMVALALDWVARLLDGPVLTALLEREFGDPGLLDGLRPRRDAAGFSRAHGPRLTALVFSGNVPGVPALSLASSLLLKSPCLAKAASGEPVFPALFAQALAAVDPDLGRAVAALTWRGGDTAIEDVLLREADALVVYGGDQALDSLRRRTPAATRFVGYGHKLSFGVIGREALAAGLIGDTARRAARDVSMFDQQGCLSPHLFYVEGDSAAAQRFGEVLAEALARFEAEVPRGRIGPGEAAAIQRLRGTYELRAVAEPGVAVHASPGGTAWTVLVDADPRFEASCLNRTVRIKPLADLARLPAQLQGLRRWLQSVGVALPASRVPALAEALGALGATRLCPLGRMAEPTAEWHHDGRPNLGDLARWTDCDA